ncbi:MAG: hypothetical protein ABEJ91_00010 [Candidatus Nanohaloarchaea archaeon]
MGLEDYREDLEQLGASIESQISRSQAYRIKSSLDRVMPVVLLLIGFVLVFEFFLSVTPAMQQWITWANWTLIAYYATRLVVSYRLSTNHDKFIHRHWLDILLVVPVFSLMQEVRLARLAPALDDLPVFERGILYSLNAGKNAETAAKMTRITRILKKSV